MMTLGDIESLAKQFAEKRHLLGERVTELHNEIEAVKRRHLEGIQTAAVKVADYQRTLHTAIAASPYLFQRPRTLVLHGIKVGLQKGKGGLDWDDNETVVKLIKRHFPELAEVLIKVEEKPIKSALASLPAADLKRIGVRVIETGDQVIIAPADSDVDKLVVALLKEVEPETT